MSIPDEIDYFAARAEALRRDAKNATDLEVAALHMEFAAQYDLLRFELLMKALGHERSRSCDPSQLAAPLAISSEVNPSGEVQRHAAAW